MRLAVLQSGISVLTGRLARPIGLLALLCFSFVGVSTTALGQGFSFISPSSNATAQAMAPDTVVVMPFENRSQMAKYNWIRESFAILLGDVLDVPGISVVGVDERNLAFEKMNLSPNDLLTRAAMIRVAGNAQANLALVGEFDIGEDKENTTIAITARLIETREGRLVGNKAFNYSGPLSDLQQWQGQLAWNIVYERNPTLPYSKDQMVRRAKQAPPLAYESFVKGIQTRDAKMRESFLRRAIQEYESAGAAGHFAQAIYELGLLHYRQADFAEAAKLFKGLAKDDPNYAESLFYLGLAAYKAGDNAEAASAFENLAGVIPMLEAVNNAGAALLAKGENEKALQFLRRAVANSPNDAVYRFNYGYAQWRVQNFAEAAQHLRVVVKANPRDGEAQFLLAKSLAASGQQAEAAQADNEAKRYLSNYAKWAVAPDRIPMLVRFKDELNRAAFYKMERQQQTAPNRPSAQQAPAQQNLDRARQLISAGNDAEGLNETQRVLAIDSTNAEAHFLRAIVFQRRNQTESAISALQSAVSYNPRLVEAHIALARLYLARGGRALALAHCKQALGIDPQNRDAIALKQQIETGQ
ncbi:MAG: Beta-barrel assembly-enhancing protease [Acidobacteria bacterium]|nr:Beta-barrel assembly-enhancing protease [Acidobacteriota bacterium]